MEEEEKKLATKTKTSTATSTALLISVAALAIISLAYAILPSFYGGRPTVTLYVNGVDTFRAPTSTPGTAVTLSWKSTKAINCETNGWTTGVQGASGSKVVYPTVSSQYAIWCMSGSFKSLPDMVYVPVDSSTPTVTLLINDLDIFKAPTSTVGFSQKLSWTSTNALSCESNGWAVVTSTPTLLPPTGAYYVYTMVSSQYAIWCKNAIATSLPDMVYVPVLDELPKITVTSPNGGEQWWRGETYNINWTATGFAPSDNVKFNIFLYDEGGPIFYVLLFNNVPILQNGYSWTIPDTIATSTRYKIQISSNGGAAWDRSDNSFSIY